MQNSIKVLSNERRQGNKDTQDEESIFVMFSDNFRA